MGRQYGLVRAGTGGRCIGKKDGLVSLMITTRSVCILGALVAAPLANAGGSDTPENAVRALQRAYTQKNLEAAVAALDFVEEGRQMLQETNPVAANDSEVIQQTAAALELEFRTVLIKDGFPDFSKMTCTFGTRQQMAPGLVKLSEQCVSAVGIRSVENRIVMKKDNGWRVVLPSPVF
jgi:hypothetical protein